MEGMIRGFHGRLMVVVRLAVPFDPAKRPAEEF
jgi:hypothetical protein